MTKDSGEYIAQKNDIKINPDGTISRGVDNNGRTKIWDLTKDSGLAIDKDWNIKITEEKGKITKKSQPSLTVDKELNKQVEDLFNEEIIDSLTKLTKQKDPFTHFRGFLEHAKAMKEEYVEAAKELKEMLWKNYPKLEEAIAIENKNFKNPQLATQVMDRLKAIFATIPREQKDSKREVVNLATQRNLEYRKHHGRSVLADFSNNQLKIDYVKLAKGLPEKPTLVPKDNLIGFTAFYKRNAGDARGMSMTAYGQTNVLSDTFSIDPEEEKELRTNAQGWLLDNLKKQTEQLKSIAKSIGKFNGKGVDLTNSPLTDEGFLSGESIITLLKWESIDLWKKKITLNTKIVKYFLAECANESIGIQIDSITIEDSQQVEQQPIKMTFNASEATAQANIKKSDFSIGVAFGGGRKEEKNQDSGYGGYTEQEGGTSTGSGDGGTSLEAHGGSTDQNSSIHTWSGTGWSENGNWSGGR